jgi:hypothetical protein
MLEHAVKACTVGIAEQQFSLRAPSVVDAWSSKVGRRAAGGVFPQGVIWPSTRTASQDVQGSN